MKYNMTQDEEDLLLKDLCVRLPYGVLIQEKCLEYDEMFLPYEETNRLINIDVSDRTLMTNGGSFYHIDEIKPYLFPLSSMTDEQLKLFDGVFLPNGHVVASDLGLDYLNSIYVDYRGLIPMGLAIDATGLNIY